MVSRLPFLKIIVGGPYHSGKTTTVQFLDPNATSLERKQADGRTTTVGFDSGKLILCNHNGMDFIVSKQELDLRQEDFAGWEQRAMIVLFGCAGQMRFKDVRRATMRGAKGVLFVVDSTNPGHIGHCTALFEEIGIVLGENIPMVVLANKQDLPEAIGAQQVKGLLSIDTVPVFEVSALTGVGIKEALLKLIKIIRASQAESEDHKDDEELRHLALI